MKNLVFGILLASASFSLIANDQVPAVPAEERSEVEVVVQEPASEVAAPAPAPVQAEQV